MNEEYLSIKESLGYINVRKALWNIFSINLEDIKIRVGEYENFSFDIFYDNYELNFGISSTGKGIQFETGEGGIFTILFENPKYPEESFLKKIFFHNFIEDNKISGKLEFILGRHEEDIEYAMKILKGFLDSDTAKIVLKSE